MPGTLPTKATWYQATKLPRLDSPRAVAASLLGYFDPRTPDCDQLVLARREPPVIAGHPFEELALAFPG